MNIENISPCDIERRSMEIIEGELADTSHLSDGEKQVVKRTIHATADFEYLDNMRFSKNSVELAEKVLKQGAVIITDTKMALSGISKPAVHALGCELHCFISDSDVAESAKANMTTRASVSMEKAAELFHDRNTVFVIGNAPTALIKLSELIKKGVLTPSLVIGAPVGFVNVVQSKRLIMDSGVPYIVADGRKGGSTVAAAICNALLYRVYDRDAASVR